MSAAHDDELASAYVIGTLDSAESEAARIRAVEDRNFAARVQEWETRLNPLLPEAEEALPDGLLARIEAAIEASGVDLPGTVTRRANTGEWTQVRPGLNIKVLNHIEKLNRRTIMVRLDAGAEYDSHQHSQDEEIFMISGDLIIGGLTLGPGDFHIARAGREHPVSRTKTGCVCIISQAIDW
ncbi:MAG: cupin domain-containing protein [Aestuariivirga sp.]